MNVSTNNNTKCILGLEALQNVIDPEIGLNVIDLGLIYKLDFDETEMKIQCTMTLTTQFCPMGESIMDGVEKTLQTTFPGYEIVMDLTFNPPWKPEMISKEGRNFLTQ